MHSSRSSAQRTLMDPYLPLRNNFFWAHAVRARGSDGRQNVLSLIGYSHMLENRWEQKARCLQDNTNTKHHKPKPKPNQNNPKRHPGNLLVSSYVLSNWSIQRLSNRFHWGWCRNWSCCCCTWSGLWVTLFRRWSKSSSSGGTWKLKSMINPRCFLLWTVPARGLRTKTCLSLPMCWPVREIHSISYAAVHSCLASTREGAPWRPGQDEDLCPAGSHMLLWRNLRLYLSVRELAGCVDGRRPPSFLSSQKSRRNDLS